AAAGSRANRRGVGAGGPRCGLRRLRRRRPDGLPRAHPGGGPGPLAPAVTVRPQNSEANAAMPIIETIVVLALIALNGVLAGSEMAIVSSRKGRLKHLAASSRGASAAVKLVEDPGTFLSTV